MKPLLAILLSVMISLQPLSKMLMVIEYQVNKNYIATVLCINKTRPEMHCEGKCHLTKELKVATQNEEELPASVKDVLVTVYFCETTFHPSFQAPITVTEKGKSAYQEGISRLVVPAIFHPPTQLV